MEGGLVQVPEFGLTGDIMDRRDNARLADMTLITVMFLFAMYYGGMLKQWGKEPHLMYFCFFCLSLGSFFGIDNEILALDVIPHLSFIWLQKLIFGSTLLTFLFFSLYVFSYLGEKDYRVFKWLRYSSALYLTLVVFVPNHYLVDTLWVSYLMQLLAFGIVLYAIFSKWHIKGRATGAISCLGSFFS